MKPRPIYLGVPGSRVQPEPWSQGPHRTSGVQRSSPQRGHFGFGVEPPAFIEVIEPMRVPHFGHSTFAMIETPCFAATNAPPHAGQVSLELPPMLLILPKVALQRGQCIPNPEATDIRFSPQ